MMWRRKAKIGIPPGAVPSLFLHSPLAPDDSTLSIPQQPEYTNENLLSLLRYVVKCGGIEGTRKVNQIVGKKKTYPWGSSQSS